MSDEAWNEAEHELLSLPGSNLAEQLRARLALHPEDAEARTLLADLQILGQVPGIEPEAGFEQRLAFKLAALPLTERPGQRLAGWSLGLAAAVAAVLFLLPHQPGPDPSVTADLRRISLPAAAPYGLELPRQPEPTLQELSARRLAYPPEQIHDSPVPL